MNACMWAILSHHKLKFIYNSFDIKLNGISLFDLIHPEEITLAKKDLCQFIKSKLLAGSVTRCRLKDYVNNYCSWIIVDIIMYVATDDLALAFFHQEKDSICGTACSTTQRDCLMQAFENHPHHTQERIFHILDNQTQSVIMSWPDHYPNEMSLDDRPAVSPSIVSCFRCVQQPPKLTPSGLCLQSLCIDYGSLSFIITKRSMPKIPKITIKKPSKYNQKFMSVEDLVTATYKCQSCGTQSSPEWRRGPSGHKTLCNACGLRYSRSIARQEKMAQQQQQQQQQQQENDACSPLSFLDMPRFICKNSFQ
ncbi:hypothetical protein BCV71DRAFT_293216 [Rhizopus microsporus]|uniref:GATA-type domain-containing protein n=1 Tax=Rhizopus microsporus TaxID=58291 RepID=A0A1X0RSI1_RHIZD|nr:hypothetical protein BCV71DRAFT_293216 [Rhizopus microsporus]